MKAVQNTKKLKKINASIREIKVRALGCHCGCQLKMFLAVGKGYTQSQLS
jgi:hypothetical protein